MFYQTFSKQYSNYFNKLIIEYKGLLCCIMHRNKLRGTDMK